MVVLKQNRDAMFALKSYRVTCIRKSVYDDPKRKNEYTVATLTLQKPNKTRYDEWQFNSLPVNVSSSIMGRRPFQTLICDGRQWTVQISGTPQQRPYRTLMQLQNPMGIGLEFFDAQQSEYDDLLTRRKKGVKFKISYDGTEKVEGVECQKVSVVLPADPDQFIEAERETYFMGSKDHLLHRMDSYMKFKGSPGSKETTTLRDIVLNAPVKPGTFVRSGKM